MPKYRDYVEVIPEYKKKMASKEFTSNKFTTPVSNYFTYLKHYINESASASPHGYLDPLLTVGGSTALLASPFVIGGYHLFKKLPPPPPPKSEGFLSSLGKFFRFGKKASVTSHDIGFIPEIPNDPIAWAKLKKYTYTKDKAKNILMSLRES